jgi:hypothetical protein
MCRDFMQFAARARGSADPLAIKRSRASQNATRSKSNSGRTGIVDGMAATGQECSCITPQGGEVRLAESTRL